MPVNTVAGVLSGAEWNAGMRNTQSDRSENSYSDSGLDLREISHPIVNVRIGTYSTRNRG